jgi:hypothetical protein
MTVEVVNIQTSITVAIDDHQIIEGIRGGRRGVTFNTLFVIVTENRGSEKLNVHRIVVINLHAGISVRAGSCVFNVHNERLGNGAVNVENVDSITTIADGQYVFQHHRARALNFKTGVEVKETLDVFDRLASIPNNLDSVAVVSVRDSVLQNVISVALADTISKPETSQFIAVAPPSSRIPKSKNSKGELPREMEKPAQSKTASGPLMVIPSS